MRERLVRDAAAMRLYDRPADGETEAHAARLGSREVLEQAFAHGRRYAGAVSYIASVAEFTPRNVQTTKDRVQLVYEVRVRVASDTAVDLKPGLPADVRFATPSGGSR